MPCLRRKSTGTLSGKTPALPHASGNPVESSSLDNPVESCSLDVLAVFAPKSIDWAFQFSTSTGAVVVDVCCSSSDQNSWFEHGKDIQWSEVPAIEVSVPYLLPLNLRKTSRAPIYIWQKQATHHSSETCLCTLDLPIVDLMVPVQYRCINLSEITRGHPLAIWDVIGKPLSVNPCVDALAVW